MIIGEKPNPMSLINTLIELYEDQYNVKVTDLKVTLGKKEDDAPVPPPEMKNA